MLHPGDGCATTSVQNFCPGAAGASSGMCRVAMGTAGAAGNGARLTKVSGQTPPGNSCWTPRRRAAVAPPRQRCQIILRREELVGTSRFELLTPRTPSECSTRLSHVPTLVRAGTGVPRRVVSVYRTDLLQPRPCAQPKRHNRRQVGGQLRRWRNVFRRRRAARAEKELLHLLDQELLGVRRPWLQAGTRSGASSAAPPTRPSSSC